MQNIVLCLSEDMQYSLLKPLENATLEIRNYNTCGIDDEQILTDEEGANYWIEDNLS